MRTLFCALALSVFGLGPARADPPQGELNASPSAIASGLIGDADAEGVFEIVPAEHQVAVRHLRSGLVCRMDPNDANRLIIFPQAARGEDVGCETSNAREDIKLYATRFSFATNVNQQIQGASAAIQAHFPGATPYQMALRASSDGLPQSQSAHFIIRGENGARAYTRVSVAMIRGWVIKMRYTAPAASDASAQQDALMADRVWAEVLSEVADRR